MLRAIGVGLKAGAEAAGVEIPGGELAQLPELLRGHPSPRGFDLNGACFGTVALDALVTGSACVPGDALMEPTTIYVRAVLDLLRSEVPVRGLAHVTGDGLLNLLRLHAPVGYAIDEPLPVPGVFDLIARCGTVPPREMWEVFNMGCGFVCVVPGAQTADAIAVLDAHHPGAALIGRVTDRVGEVRFPAGAAG